MLGLLHCCCARITFASQGKPEEADSLLVRAIGIQQKALGAIHPSLADTLSIRAAVLGVLVRE